MLPLYTVPITSQVPKINRIRDHTLRNRDKGDRLAQRQPIHLLLVPVHRDQNRDLQQGKEKIRRQPRQYRRPVGDLLLKGEADNAQKEGHDVLLLPGNRQCVTAM